MKNYYEVLEVNETASQEVIERVYKLLAKKYHPDMNLDNPKEAEEKFKEVTTAYETLSNPDKRKKYDDELAYERHQSETISYASEENNYYNSSSSTATNNKSNTGTEKEMLKARKKQLEEALKKQARLEYEAEKAYNDAYYKALEDMGYTVVYKKTFKDYLRIFLTFLILAIIIYILWLIPPIREKILEVYENSGPIKKILENLWNAIFNK